jgi:ubiquinone/menaquinone biosynthesis C-methylase UbiE
MIEEQSDLVAAARTWNSRDETLESVNRRIHDGTPLGNLTQRASGYVAGIFNLFNYAVLKDDASVMEIGSGTGYIMEALDTFAKYHRIRLRQIIGLDIAEHMIEKAKLRLGSRPRFSFIHYDGINVPLPDKSLDMICSVAALQHVPKPYVYNLFFEIYRLLKNDGYAVIQLLGFKMLPTQAQRISWQEEVRKQIYRIEGHWHHFYSAEELVMVLPASGFKHVDIRDGESIWFLVRPNALPLPADFSPDRYLEINPDVATAGADPAIHWKEYGYREGRRWK